MTFFENRYYRTSRLFLLFIGQWPYDRSMVKWMQRIVFSLLLGSFLFVQVSKFFTAEITVDLVVDILPNMLLSVVTGIRYFFVSCCTKDLITMLDFIEEESSALTEKEEIELLQMSHEEARLSGLIIISFVYPGAISFLAMHYIPNVLDIVLPLNESRPYRFPCEAEYFLDSRTYFYPIMLHMQLCILMEVTVVVATEMLAASIILHACGMFRIIGYRLEHLFDEDSSEFPKFLLKVARIVEYHNSVLRYIQLLVKNFAPPNSFQIGLVVIILTSLMLQLHRSLQQMEPLEFVTLNVFRIIAHFIIVFLNVLPGQKLLNHSGDLFFKAYSSQWYWASPRHQRMLLFLLQRTIEPCLITIGRIINMSFEIFSAITQMSLSYFTVVHSVQE